MRTNYFPRALLLINVFFLVFSRVHSGERITPFNPEAEENTTNHQYEDETRKTAINIFNGMTCTFQVIASQTSQFAHIIRIFIGDSPENESNRRIAEIYEAPATISMVRFYPNLCLLIGEQTSTISQVILLTLPDMKIGKRLYCSSPRLSPSGRYFIALTAKPRFSSPDWDGGDLFLFLDFSGPGDILRFLDNGAELFERYLLPFGTPLFPKENALAGNYAVNLSYPYQTAVGLSWMENGEIAFCLARMGSKFFPLVFDCSGPGSVNVHAHEIDCGSALEKFMREDRREKTVDAVYPERIGFDGKTFVFKSNIFETKIPVKDFTVNYTVDTRKPISLLDNLESN